MADKFGYIYEDPSSSSQITGSTPYGIYDTDSEFQTESLQICKFIARRLGHPVMQLEFNSGSIYAMFEEAVSEYSQQINHYNMKNWLWNQYGNESTGSSLNSTGSNSVVHSTMGSAIHLSEQYGQQAGVGGNATLHSGSITLAEGVQEYNLQSIYSSSFAASGSENKRIEIQRVLNYAPASMTRFYDPFVGSYEQRQMLDAFGFGEYSPAATFILQPVFYDVLRANAIETSDRIRKSAFSFEIINNKCRIFPIPKQADIGDKVWFEYYIRDDANATSQTYTDNRVSDPSNTPYKNLTYSEINATGRQWIRKYALALSKELLGIIRSKYASMPLPNGEVSLDGEALKTEGREEKTLLLEELQTFLDSVTLREQAAAEQEVADANQAVLNKSPLGIYLG